MQSLISFKLYIAEKLQLALFLYFVIYTSSNTLGNDLSGQQANKL